VALEARPSRASRHWKQLATWTHILLVWPLPALLTFHILSVYYF
jgi:nitrite reductase (NADH) large subunit